MENKMDRSSMTLVRRDRNTTIANSCATIDYKDWDADTQESFQTMVSNRAVGKVMERKFIEMIEEDMEENPESYNLAPALQTFLDKKSGAGISSKYLFFTINIKEDCQDNIELLAKTLKRAVKKKWINKYLANFEQRGQIDTPEFGTGVHINLLIEKSDEYIKKKPKEMFKEMKNTWKNLCNVNVYGCFPYPKCNLSPVNFVNYIHGVKKDEDKEVLISADKLWRSEQGIPHVLGDEDYFDSLMPERSVDEFPEL